MLLVVAWPMAPGPGRALGGGHEPCFTPPLPTPTSLAPPAPYLFPCSEWLEQKRAREVACVCLRNIAPPDQYSSDATHAEDYWSTVEKELKIEDRVKELRMKEARRQRNADEAQAEEYWKEAQPEEYWKAVGQLLQRVFIGELAESAIIGGLRGDAGCQHR